MKLTLIPLIYFRRLHCFESFFGLYYLIGIEHLEGVHRGSAFKDFTEFFFSAQTFTTVGYGHISPNGFMANSVSTFEAFLGLLSLPLPPVYLRDFAQPWLFLKFSSKNALIAPYLNGKALMFSVAPFKNNLSNWK
ncbi:MAG: ion channel [Chitinophagaceae bacterium]